MDIETGVVVSKSSAEKINDILAQEGFAAVLRHLAWWAQRELDDAEEIRRVLITVANQWHQMSVSERAEHLRGLAKLAGPRQAKKLLAEAAALEPCAERVLAPDDLVRPCILPKGHEGYHDTGR